MNAPLRPGVRRKGLTTLVASSHKTREASFNGSPGAGVGGENLHHFYGDSLINLN